MFRQEMERSAKKKKSNIVLALDIGVDRPQRLLTRSLRILNTTHEHLCALKLNRQSVLPLGLFNDVQKVISRAKELNLLTIMDAKINDVGNTNRAIAEYYYRAGFDAVIASPFVGWNEGLQPVFEVAQEMNRGVIVLVYMSHKGAVEGYGQIVQDANTGQLVPQYRIFAERALKWKADGAVVGATYPEKIREVHAVLKDKVAIYSPGVGAQGGDAQTAVKAGADYLIVGRYIVEAEDPARKAEQIRDVAWKSLRRRGKNRIRSEFYSSRPLCHSSFFSMSLTAERIAELRLGYIFDRTSSSKPSK